MPKESEGTTKGLRVVNSIDPCILKSTFLDYSLVIVPLQLPVTSRQGDNVVAISIYHDLVIFNFIQVLLKPLIARGL